MEEGKTENTWTFSRYFLLIMTLWCGWMTFLRYQDDKYIRFLEQALADAGAIKPGTVGRSGVLTPREVVFRADSKNPD